MMSHLLMGVWSQLTVRVEWRTVLSCSVLPAGIVTHSAQRLTELDFTRRSIHHDLKTLISLRFHKCFCVSVEWMSHCHEFRYTFGTSSNVCCVRNINPPQCISQSGQVYSFKRSWHTVYVLQGHTAFVLFPWIPGVDHFGEDKVKIMWQCFPTLWFKRCSKDNIHKLVNAADNGAAAVFYFLFTFYIFSPS